MNAQLGEKGEIYVFSLWHLFFLMKKTLDFKVVLLVGWLSQSLMYLFVA